MPLVKLTTRKTRTRAEKDALLLGVHQALVDAFHIPKDDCYCRIETLDPADFIVPPGKSDAFVLIEIGAFPGRSIDAKRKLYAGIIEILGKQGIAPADIFITVNEMPLDNWGIRGGVPASDIQLGFKLDV